MFLFFFVFFDACAVFVKIMLCFLFFFDACACLEIMRSFVCFFSMPAHVLSKSAKKK